ncbi:phage integrase N-terminal SAM-like domain-containing protein [Acidithiobacillus thiooxidans]|uniref:phage integrase N-terminal SAM-like domain-containing protein n=1 Tax=Acidithiobacillus thiooxidans TaxID=930 RepID=UPI00285AAFA2|nr:phage integrase N-terminal SAM-like domain-containing protein [Acidithiobacillus thiooxidans]MDR7928299.1 phage integrase N-terminal SAM-like domain-containing protein [Acidithiobacillus thiooxidans]
MFHRKRHPQNMGAAEVEAFLSYLANERHVSSSTQNQAKAALLFLYKQVLNVELPWLDNITNAKPSQHLPVVLTPTEARALLHELSGTMWLVAALLYGTGMRLLTVHEANGYSFANAKDADNNSIGISGRAFRNISASNA